jgi:hypothetical protein
MGEWCIPLQVQSMDFTDGQSWFHVSWRDRSVEYLRRPYGKEPITGELHVLEDDGRWLGGEVRLCDPAGVVARKGFVFDRDEGVDHALLATANGGTGDFETG